MSGYILQITDSPPDTIDYSLALLIVRGCSCPNQTLTPKRVNGPLE
jgi:hypothetical protein